MSDCTCETRSCVACDVKNCVYNGEGNICNAGKIKVGNGVCASSNETCCDTFKAK